MGRTTTQIPMSHRVLSPIYNNHTGEKENPRDQPPVQLSDSIFGFLEEEVTVLSSPESDDYDIQQEIENDDVCDIPEEDSEDKIKFWETQQENLHTTLFRTTSLEAKIRNITKEAIGDIEVAGNVCSCSLPVSGGCRSCQMREICSRLQNSGFDSAICRSKWKSSVDIPSGEHTFLDVIDNSNRKKGAVRVIVELELRGQFEMKKGSDEYNSLVCKLPEIFVGKSNRLQSVIKIMSICAKRCMREKKMHLGPWRKQQYMQAKWLKVMERTTATTTVSPPLEVDVCYTRPARVRASMLTMDLRDDLPNMSYLYAHVVEVL